MHDIFSALWHFIIMFFGAILMAGSRSESGFPRISLSKITCQLLFLRDIKNVPFEAVIWQTINYFSLVIGLGCFFYCNTQGTAYILSELLFGGMIIVAIISVIGVIKLSMKEDIKDLITWLIVALIGGVVLWVVYLYQ